MRLAPLSRRRFASLLGAVAGSGLVPRTESAGASLLRGEAADLVQLNSNENPYGPFPAALEAIAGAQAAAARYPDAAEEELADAIARHHGVKPEQVVLGCGSSDVLRMADAAFLGPGKTVVAAEPTFEAVLAYSKVMQCEALKVPLTTDFRHDLDAMARACDARTGLVYVCNPNNPTGTIVGGTELDAFVARVPSTAVVIVDEAYHHFVEDPGYRSLVDAIASRPNVVVARTFSKIYGMAGLRLGYAVASEANAKALRAHASWGNANACVLAAALASLGRPELVEAQRARLNATRRSLCTELERDGRRYVASEANFVMIDTGADVKPLIAAFKERKILVGRRFAALPTFLRVSVGRPEETAAFVQALRELLPGKGAPSDASARRA